MVRALASHQCGPGSIPGPGVICGLSLLLVLVLVPRVFLQVLRFSSLLKNQHFQIPSGISGRRATLWRCHYKLQFPILLSTLNMRTIQRPYLPCSTSFVCHHHSKSLWVAEAHPPLQCCYLQVLPAL